jgi:hypothetical protein
MSKRTRWILVIGLVLLITAVGAVSLYFAMHHVPSFYRRALAVEPARQEAASNEMLQKVAMLTNALKQPNRWEVLFTAEQINGWLAVDLMQNHSHAMPSILQDPRVAIDPKQVTVAGRVEIDGQWTVIRLIVVPYLSKPNTLELRIVKIRAGLLPVPLRKLLDRISNVASKEQVDIEWRQAGGDPVAVVTLPMERIVGNDQVCIDELRLGEGEIYLAGKNTKNTESDP